MADTYPLKPNRITNSTPEFKTTVVRFENGNEQRSASYAIPKTTFRLVHQAIGMQELNIIVDFFKSRKGSYLPFYFVNHIDGKTYKVRFKEDKLNIEYINAYFANIDVELITC